MPEKQPSSQLMIALLPALLAAAWLVSKAQWFWRNRPDLEFGWVVLMLCAFVIWDGWAKKPELRFGHLWLGLPLALAGLALLFLVQIYQAAFGMMPASLAGLALGAQMVIFGNVLLVFGWPGIRHFGFAVCFFLIALPLPTAIHSPVVGGLQELITRINVELLSLGGIPAQRVGSLIHLPNGTVGVDEACSGIRSIQSTVMATLFIGYFSLRSRSLQTVLFALGIGLAVFGNLLRSLYLSVTANAKGLQAVGEVHDAAGWSILIFTAGGVAASAWILSRYEQKLDRLRGQAAAKNQPTTTS